MHTTSRHISTITKPVGEQEERIFILIPCAGAGKRMKSYGPKGLVEIKYGQSILGRQLSLISSNFKNYKTVIVSGFESEKIIMNSPVEAVKVENELYEDTNVCRSIGMGSLAIPEANNILLINGDLVFSHTIFSCFDFSKSFIFVEENCMKDNEVGCIISKNNSLENMMYDLPDKWGQIAFFKGKELELLRKISTEKCNKKLFTFEMINKILESGGTFKCIKDKSIKIIDVDTSKDIKRAKDII